MDNDLTVLIVQTDRRRSNNRCIDLCADSARVRIAHFDTACISVRRCEMVPHQVRVRRRVLFVVRLFTSPLSPFAAHLRFVLCDRTSDQFAAAMPYYLRFVLHAVLASLRCLTLMTQPINLNSICMPRRLNQWTSALQSRIVCLYWCLEYVLDPNGYCAEDSNRCLYKFTTVFLQTHNSQLPTLSLSRPSRHCRYALQPIFNHLQAYILICIYPRTCPWRIITRSWSDNNES